MTIFIVLDVSYVYNFLSIISKIAKIIKGATLYALQHFHNSRVLHPEFFREIKPDYSEDELMGLKAIAEPLVKKCIVR